MERVSSTRAGLPSPVSPDCIPGTWGRDRGSLSSLSWGGGLEGLNVLIFKLRSVRYFANAVKRSKEANMNYDNDVVANRRASPKAY